MEPITITLNQLMLLLLLVWASGTVGLALLFKVSWWHLTTFFAVGAGMGLAWSALYYFNVKRQAEHNQMVRGSSRQTVSVAGGAHHDGEKQQQTN